MKVSELVALLAAHDQDLEVIGYTGSDYYPIEDKPEVVYGVLQSYGIMRSHPTMSLGNKAKEKKYLLIG